MKIILNFIIIFLIFIKISNSSNIINKNNINYITEKNNNNDDDDSRNSNNINNNNEICKIENGLNLKIENNDKTSYSCYRFNHSKSISLNCEGDKNQEWKKNQNSLFNIDQLILIENGNENDNFKTIILEQKFKTIVSDNGSIIINNVNEHIAFFQANFKIENNLIISNNNETIKLLEFNYIDPYGNYYNNGNKIKNNINNNNEWDVIINQENNNNNNNNNNLLFNYYQNNPIDTLYAKPNNTRLWFKESTKKMKSGKLISNISFNSLNGWVQSKWIIPKHLDFILINVTYTSTMADIVTSSRHIENNSYKLVDFGFYDIKKLNLKTSDIIPIEKEYFSNKLI